MNKKTKLLTSGIVLTTLLGVVTPVANFQIPQSAFAELKVSNEVPATTTVNITKLVGTNFKTSIENKDGEVLTLDKLSEQLGTTVKGLAGVTFTAYKLPNDITKEKLDKLKDAKNETQLKAIAEKEKVTLGNSTKLTTTDASGVTKWSVNKADYGQYIVVETESPATVSSALGVPFVMSFPMSASNGSGYLSEVNVYPKNVQGDEPTPGKDVNHLANNNASYRIGEEFDFILKGTIPTNIQDYELYDLTDEFDTQLTPTLSGLTAKFGTHDLVKDEDYTVELTGQKLKFSLTEKGIKKIADAVDITKRDKAKVEGDGEEKENTDEKPFIQVNVKAQINSTVKLVKDVENKVKLSFDNKKDGNKKVEKEKDSEIVRVYTGGKLFKKVDSTDSTALEGAEFELLDEAKQPIVWTDELKKANQKLIDAGKFTTSEVGQPIKMKSIAGGEFGISGLGYGKEMVKFDKNGVIIAKATEAESRVYYLKETKAPEGYVVAAELIQFVVGPDAVTREVQALDITGTATDIKNSKRPLIPNTGGIGSVIFILSGIAIMALAALGLKRRNTDA